MDWPAVFAVLVVSHLVGDFALQTEWQARNKRGGLSRDPVARRALCSHVLTYTLAFVPAFVWLWDSLGPGVFALAALLAGTHLLQDDGRALDAYMRTVKRTSPSDYPIVSIAVDQTFHIVVLLGLALVAAA
jgi:uncharacterized protein DUF3307